MFIYFRPLGRGKMWFFSDKLVPFNAQNNITIMSNDPLSDEI